MSVTFYVGLHQPADAKHFERACISINRLRTRRKPLGCEKVLLDSGAFTELAIHHAYRHGPEHYAADIRRLCAAGVATISAAVAQDYMCEPFMLKKTGLTVAQHQAMTISRCKDLLACDVPVPIMPVLQGFEPVDYVRHAEAYGNLLAEEAWVGVGSVCKRNGSPIDVVHVLSAIRLARPDLRLHGFGLKKTALMHPSVRAMLYSADSMAWSYHARINGRSGNDWREAKAFCDQVERVSSISESSWQMPLPFMEAGVA